MKSKKNIDLENVLRTAGISEGTAVNFVQRKMEEILNYVPFSRYHNNAFGTDSSHEESAYILDAKGNILCQVVDGYSSRYSDGSHGDNKGQSVGDALERLGDKAKHARYVLVAGRDEEQDNTIIVGINEHFQSRGVVTKDTSKLTLYELKVKQDGTNNIL
jgi:hypothetical protein